ncbi:RimK family alpha-L-glutamate ligase [Candidatus Bathyarchaeota archaeon]|nr:MAG: RimK family alpha-L-glutamate ligase [Candidatus Bathyarchaeota archaeon]
MKILILHGSKPSKNSSEMVEAAEEMGHIVLAGPTNDISSLISQEGSRFWLGKDEVTDFDLCFLRSFGPGSTEQVTRRISLMEHMETAGIKLINSTYPFRRSRDKYSTQYTLHAAGIPIPKTFTTESLARAYEMTEEMIPVIYKPILSSMGRGSMKFDDTDLAFNAYKTLDRLYQPLIIQGYIKNPGRDIRVFIIGDECVGAVYKYIPEGHWKSNVAQGGKMVEEEMKPEIIELGFRAARAMGLDYCGVDILESPNGPVVLEVNAAPGWQGLKEATEKEIAKLIVEYGVSQVE